MPRISAQVILRTSDNIPANYATNTYFFDVETDLVAPEGSLEDQSVLSIAPALVDLYNELNDQADLFGGLATSGHRIKFVEIDGPKPQYPYAEVVWAFTTAPSASVLPSECCVVSSFEAVQSAGINQATRRGRVFLGPLNLGALNALTGRLVDADRVAIATAFQTFAQKQDEAGFSGWQWMVYSRKNDAMSRVVMGHVDNAFDTQRRRGVESTLRSVWEE